MWPCSASQAIQGLHHLENLLPNLLIMENSPSKPRVRSPPRQPVIEREFTGPLPGSDEGQFTAKIWWNPDGTYHARLDIPSACPVMVFQPIQLINCHGGFVSVYQAPDPFSGEMGLNVAVGPGVKVTYRRNGIDLAARRREYRQQRKALRRNIAAQRSQATANQDDAEAFSPGQGGSGSSIDDSVARRGGSIDERQHPMKNVQPGISGPIRTQDPMDQPLPTIGSGIYQQARPSATDPSYDPRTPRRNGE